MRHNRVVPITAVAAMLLGVTLGGVTAGAADKLSIAVPGVPPVFSTVMIYTAKHGGFYKKRNMVSM